MHCEIVGFITTNWAIDTQNVYYYKGERIMFEKYKLKKKYMETLSKEVKEKVEAEYRYIDAQNRPFTVGYMQDIVNACKAGVKLEVKVTLKDGTIIELKSKEELVDPSSKYRSELF